VRTRAFASAIGLVCLLPCAAARAQPPSRLYVSAGAHVALRDSGERTVDLLAGERSSIPAVSAGAGIWLSEALGVEGSISVTRGQSFPWIYSYLFDESSLQRVVSRDVPMVGLVRIAMLHGRRMGLDVVWGGGWTWHRAQSEITAGCGRGFINPVCVPLETPRVSDTMRTFEPLLALGADAPLRLSSRFALAPGVRMLTIHRRDFLTGYNHRGPVAGNGVIVTFGIAAMWRDR
jgi:hypothetical protein